MAGIKETRVDYKDTGGAKSDDKLTGGNKQDSSVPKPIRAGVPVGPVENEFTSEENKASLATRPNTGMKK